MRANDLFSQLTIVVEMEGKDTSIQGCNIFTWPTHASNLFSDCQEFHGGNIHHLFNWFQYIMQEELQKAFPDYAYGDRGFPGAHPPEPLPPLFLKSNNWIMRECISIHVGQAGIKKYKIDSFGRMLIRRACMTSWMHK